MHENFITCSQCCQIVAMAAPWWMAVAVFQQTTMDYGGGVVGFKIGNTNEVCVFLQLSNLKLEEPIFCLLYYLHI